MARNKKLRFSEQQAITVTAQSTNVIQLAEVASKLGSGKPLFVRLTVNEAFTAAGAGVLDIDLQDGATAGAVNNSLHKKSAIGKATLVLGYETFLLIPPTTQKFLAIQYTVGTGPMLTGKITAEITTDPPSNPPS